MDKHLYYKILKEDQEVFESNIDNVIYSKFDNMENLQAEEYAEQLLECSNLQHIKEGNIEASQELNELSDEIFFVLEEDKNFNDNLCELLRLSLSNWNEKRNN